MVPSQLLPRASSRAPESTSPLPAKQHLGLLRREREKNAGQAWRHGNGAGVPRRPAQSVPRNEQTAC